MKMSEQFLDCVGVPEYFVTHLGAVEDVGNGLIRTVMCIQRNGTLIPVFSCVMPAGALLKNMPTITDSAREIVGMDESASCH
jgi:hypothetical protein